MQKKELEEEQARTKNKMAALLSAVAEGKLSSKSATGSERADHSAKSVVSTARSSQSGKSRQKAVSPCLVSFISSFS